MLRWEDFHQEKRPMPDDLRHGGTGREFTELVELVDVILRVASPAQARAVRDKILGKLPGRTAGSRRQALHNLRKRLREEGVSFND